MAWKKASLPDDDGGHRLRREEMVLKIFISMKTPKAGQPVTQYSIRSLSGREIASGTIYGNYAASLHEAELEAFRMPLDYLRRHA